MMEVTGSSEPGYGQIVAFVNTVLSFSVAYKGGISGPAKQLQIFQNGPCTMEYVFCDTSPMNNLSTNV
jgi:hypothetical protein